MVEQAEDETANTLVVDEVGLEDPMLFVFGMQTTYRAGHLLLDEIVGHEVEAQTDMMTLLSAEHEDIGKHITVFGEILPLSLSTSTLPMRAILNVLFLPDFGS